MYTRIPEVKPEVNRPFAKGSSDRHQLKKAIEDFKNGAPYEIPYILPERRDARATTVHVNPSDHSMRIFSLGPAESTSSVITKSLTAKESWESLAFPQRAAVFLRAADLIASKHRYHLMAVLMVAQGMMTRQAEIEVSDLIDFFRFNVKNAEELYSQQPVHNPPGIWNSLEYYALEGFVYVLTGPTSLASTGNFLAAPSLLGNTVVAALPLYATTIVSLLLQVLQEAGLPDGVIQLLHDMSGVRDVASNSNLGAVVFSGGLETFVSIQRTMNDGLLQSKYKTYPRLIAELDGINFHLIHSSADLPKTVSNTVRGAFEFQGQMSGSASIAYVPSSLWASFKARICSALEKLPVGTPEVPKNFFGPVLSHATIKMLSKFFDDAGKDQELELVTGGKIDMNEGYFIQPTIYATRNLSHGLLLPKILSRELIRGPILTVAIYDDENMAPEGGWTSICKLINGNVASYRAASIFAQDRQAIATASGILKSLGQLYINTRCNIAQVAQQPSGGGRFCGDGFKTGTKSFLERFVNVRSMKEELLGGYHVIYSSNIED